jgi:putative tricarboxylic transport membrane protein
VFGELLAATAILTSLSVLGWLGAGVVLGILFGATPGLTATAGVAVLVPLTFQLDFTASMALLLGLYVGGYFAGSIPAILVNTPGAPGNAATGLDGYPMARRGEAERAATLAILGSLIGGLVSLAILALAAPPLSKLALKFTSAEYFALGLFGLTCVAAVSRGSLLKGVAGAALGALLGCVGIDPVSGVQRLTLGLPDLLSGVALLPALLAFFAVAEVLAQSRSARIELALPAQRRAAWGQIAKDYLANKWVALQGAVVGTFIGMLPGTGPTIASWVSYGGAQRLAGKSDRELGDGHPGGIVAAETANNAVTGGALVPLLTLGIPGDTVTAVLVGALLIQGIDPGPFFIRESADLFAQILVLVLAANLLLVAVALAARRAFPLVLRIPARILVPLIAVLCVAGGFAINNAAFDVVLIALLGIAGYLLASLGVPMAPVVLGLVLGPIVETNLRNALTSARGDWSTFVTRPISAGLLAVTLVIVLSAVVAGVRRRRAG